MHFFLLTKLVFWAFWWGVADPSDLAFKKTEQGLKVNIPYCDDLVYSTFSNLLQNILYLENIRDDKFRRPYHQNKSYYLKVDNLASIICKIIRFMGSAEILLIFITLSISKFVYSEIKSKKIIVNST